LLRARLGLVPFWVIREHFDLLGMSGLDHRPVAPDDPSAHANPFAGKCFEIDAHCRKGAHILARHSDGEVAFPVAVEIEIDTTRPLAHAEHPTLDELIGLCESPEAVDILGALDAVDGRCPHAETFLSRIILGCQKLTHTSAVVGEGIDAGEPFPHPLLLEPKPARAVHHEDLRQRIAVPVGFGPAIAKLDLLTSILAAKA
jgi:hypothetical protein